MKTVILIGVGFDKNDKKIKVKIPHIEGMWIKGTVKPNQEITATEFLKQPNKILNPCMRAMDKKMMKNVIKALVISNSSLAKSICVWLTLKLNEGK